MYELYALQTLIHDFQHILKEFNKHQVIFFFLLQKLIYPSILKLKEILNLNLSLAFQLFTKVQYKFNFFIINLVWLKTISHKLCLSIKSKN